MQKMSKHSWAGALVLLIALWWAAPMPVHALPLFNPVVEYSTSSVFSTNPAPGSTTLGYQFTTSVPFTIDALAFWNESPYGTPYSFPVGLWDSIGNPLVSTNVLDTDPIEGHFQYHLIAPYSLGAGSYTIGGAFSDLTTVPYDAQGVNPISGYHWVSAVDDYNPSGGLKYPTNHPSGYGDNGVLLVNFSVVPAAPVPEPSTVLLLASGLAGLLGYGWRRKGAA
jgi:hypothetical protein